MNNEFAFITQNTIREVNYFYETRNFNAINNSFLNYPQCFLLLGHGRSTNAAKITRSLEVPLLSNKGNLGESDFDRSTNLHPDIQAMYKRIKLLNKIDPLLETSGILLINNEHFDYENCIITIIQELGNIKWLFRYSPSFNKEILLDCYLLNQIGDAISIKKTYFELETEKYSFKTEQLKKELDTEFNYNDKNYSLSKYENEIADQKRVILQIVKNIDKITGYIKNGGRDPDILNKIALLLYQLKKPPTEDIEYELMNQESEIDIINIACKQLEIANKLDGK
ncbi:hypothetical protein TPHA_0C02740 [Tetrapisispora phaffii CBS 4417]|uniref:Uncharacterized protein n=1 Tax=Tetrapisispora phaffii (strain ATCC 24235 / CBS 4417 / NBRC 1672 / NRRL Y-8282 / UCD 70-5) TaxID=1071381 RepID=G8BRQ1_TETPH|nr:hypothetical protein TPHA_0C02740 [Tetrapisispora phaffii CBS 4417]CCE62427.1 hypothetical protein TPHA_0C02740 [Tetrapisispora phaffii CBS 4417]